MNEFYENEVGSNRNVWTKKQQQVVIDYLTNAEEGLTKKILSIFMNQNMNFLRLET